MRSGGRSPTRASLALLGAGPAAALVTSAAPARGALDARLLLRAAMVGIVNGTLEELLWRALYVEVFPDDPVRGWAYPAVWFGLWHVAPQRVHAADRHAGLVAAATSLGLVWGAIAQRTGSVRWTIASHVLTDALDVSSPNVRFLAACGR